MTIAVRRDRGFDKNQTGVVAEPETACRHGRGNVRVCGAETRARRFLALAAQQLWTVRMRAGPHSPGPRARCARPQCTQPFLEKFHIRAILLPKSARSILMRTEEKIEKSSTQSGGERAVEVPMTGQTETQSSAMMRRFALPSCPKCDDLLLAPAASEFVSKREVRHRWSCEACGHEFSTSVRLFSERRSYRPDIAAR